LTKELFIFTKEGIVLKQAFYVKMAITDYAL
jgi:hypothetical protein